MGILGILGGIGPAATSNFLKMITDMTLAQNDSEHIESITFMCPNIPDRSRYILGESIHNPIVDMKKVLDKMKQLNVSCVAIPCITAHFFYEELQRYSDIEVLDAIMLTKQSLLDSRIDRVGIICTDGTRQGHVFERCFRDDINIIYPDYMMQKRVMNIIYNEVKAGDKIDTSELLDIRDELYKRGADTVLLGCSELSMIDDKTGFTDCMDILAVNAIRRSNGQVREEYLRSDNLCRRMFLNI